MGYSQMVQLAKLRGEIQEILEKTKARKRRAILARLLQLEEGEHDRVESTRQRSRRDAPDGSKAVRLGLINILRASRSAEADRRYHRHPGGR